MNDRIARALDRELNILNAELADGRITQGEYNRALRELERDARDVYADEHDDRRRDGWQMSSDEEEQRVRY